MVVDMLRKFSSQCEQHVSLSSSHLPCVSASIEDIGRVRYHNYHNIHYHDTCGASPVRFYGLMVHLTTGFIIAGELLSPLPLRAWSSRLHETIRNWPYCSSQHESLCSYVHTPSRNAIIILLLKQAYFGVYLPSYRTVFRGGHEMPTVPVTVRGGGIYHRSTSPSSQARVFF